MLCVDLGGPSRWLVIAERRVDEDCTVLTTSQDRCGA